MLVADAFEKIRINPGNFADGRKTFEEISYDDPAQFRAEQEIITEVRCAEFVRPLRRQHARSTWTHRYNAAHAERKQ